MTTVSICCPTGVWGNLVKRGVDECCLADVSCLGVMVMPWESVAMDCEPRALDPGAQTSVT